jgi:ribosomal protein S18 acetylase RimI-like enzyme
MVEKICALHQRWDPAKFGFVDHVVSMYGKWLTAQAKDSRSVFLVAAADGRFVAFLIGTVERAVPICRPSEYGFVRDLWVEEDYRREGVGRKVMQAAIGRFGALGIAQIRLETAAANEPARAFFASCGFRPSATEMLIEQPLSVAIGFDEVHMVQCPVSRRLTRCASN